MVELRTLGGLELRGADGATVDAVLTQPKRAALLVYLATNGGGGPLANGPFLRRDPLLGRFWPEQTESRARGSLRQMLYALRKDLGPELVLTRGDDEVGINRDVVWCDVSSFDQAIDDGELERAAELYRGPFLRGFFLKGNVEFDQWVETERERLDRAYGRALETLADRAALDGDLDQALTWLRRWADHSPYSTRTALKYMEALAESGDRAGALHYADRLAQRVQEDLGAAPSPDVTALAERLRHDPVERHETRFVRVTPSAESHDLDALREALGERYTIEREAGSGGMATVYLAEDIKHHRQVAIKVLRPELAAAIGSERFLREIEIAAQLNHPHLLPVHDSGQAGQFLYYVTPYAGGESVRDRLNREKQLPVDDAVTIASQVAGALDYAHRQGVIHRDIKPENILLQDGQALVADFGIALAVQSVDATRLTETGLSIGTPQYMSPEQATGDRELDGRSDIYSLGCVLYEMLAGEPPHTGPTVQAILAKIATDEPASISARRSSVPDPVEWTLQAALAKLPADRIQLGADFVDSLRNRTLPSGAILASKGRGDEKHFKRALTGLSVVTAALIPLAVIGWIDLTNTPAAVEIWVNLDVDPYSGFEIASDGSALVYQDADAVPHVYEFDTPEPTNLPGIGLAPFFSPDGGSVGGLSNRFIKTAPRTGGPTRIIAELPNSNFWIYRAEWGPDNYIYFTPGPNAGLSRVSGGDDGEIEVLTTPDSVAGELAHRFAEVLGNGVLFTSWWEDSSLIMAYDPATRASERIVAGSTPRYVAGGYVVFGTLDGSLYAVRFDPDRMEAVAPPVGLLDGVNVGIYGWVEFDMADNGTLVYQPAWEAQFGLVALDSNGAERPFLSPSGPIMGGFEISPDGTRIAYTRQVTGGTEVWVRTSDGAESRITGRGVNFFPIWSPDGEYLAFASDRDGRGWALYTKSADGTGEARLVVSRPAGAYPVSWSSNGEILVWDNDRGMATIPADGSSPEKAPVPDCVRGCGGYSRLSPNGRYIAYVMPGALYVSDLADPIATRQQVSVGGGGNPRWSPDGRRIYYYTTGDEELWVATLEFEDRLSVVERRKLLDLSDRRFELPGGLAMAIDPVSGDVVFRREEPTRPELKVVFNFGERLKAVGGR